MFGVGFNVRSGQIWLLMRVQKYPGQRPKWKANISVWPQPLLFWKNVSFFLKMTPQTHTNWPALLLQKRYAKKKKKKRVRCSQEHKVTIRSRRCSFHGTFLTPCFLWILSLTHSASVSSCPLSPSFLPLPSLNSLPLVCCVGSEPSLAARERRGGGGRGGGRENGRLSLHGAPLTSQRYPGE